MAKTEVIKCDCKHDFQDREYGLNRRVANLARKWLPNKVWRCTVCKKEHR